MKKLRSSQLKPATQALPLTVLAEETSLTTLRGKPGFISRAWAWLQSRPSSGSDSRRLRVAETVSLGEKRFVAVVQVAGRDFLVAGGPSNIALLAQLNPKEPFEDVLRRTMTIPGQSPDPRKRPVKRKQRPKPAVTAANPSPIVLPRRPPTSRALRFPISRGSAGHVLPKASSLCASSRSKQSLRRRRPARKATPNRRPRRLYRNSTCPSLSATCCRTQPQLTAMVWANRPTSKMADRTRSIGALGVSHTVAARAIVCVLLCLAASAEGLAQPAPARPGIAPPLRFLLASAPIQLGNAPLGPNDFRISGLGGGSPSWTIVVLLTFLTIVPSILICMTPFARLLIVFHFLRQALGLQTTPSNQTLVGLSVIMTFFLMQPVGDALYRDSIVPLQEGKVTPIEALLRGAVPMRRFMAHYVRDKDLALFLEMAKEPRPQTMEDVSFRVLLPAYILSELKAGFQIGAVLFLPFLVVDMVVASITTSVGMMQLPPVVISTPLKLLLFLMVDGWRLLIGALMRSFN